MSSEPYADPERPCPECGCPAQSRQWDGRCDSCGDPEALKHQRRIEQRAAHKRLFAATLAMVEECERSAQRRKDAAGVRFWGQRVEFNRREVARLEAE